MAKQRVNVEVTATDRTHAALSSVQQGLGRLNSTVIRLGESTNHVDRLVRVLRSNYVSFLAIREGFKGLIELGKIRIEMQRLVFTFRAATHSAYESAISMKFVHDASEKLGLNFLQAADGLARLEAAARGSNISLRTARTLWLSVSKAMVLYHLNADQVRRVMYALVEMMATGRIQSRQLRRMLGQALPIGVTNRFAHAIGVTTEKLEKMMKAGQVASKTYLPALSRAIAGAVPVGLLDEASKAFNANVNRMKNSWLDLERVINKGFFISTASVGMSAFISFVNFLKNNFVVIGEVLKTTFAAVAVVIGIRLTQAMLTAGRAGKTLTSILGDLDGVIALLGGPVGVIAVALTAFAGFIYYASKSSTEVKILGENIKGLANGFRDLTSAQIQNSIEQLQVKLSKLKATSIEVRASRLDKQTPLAYSEPGQHARNVARVRSLMGGQVKILTDRIEQAKAQLAKVQHENAVSGVLHAPNVALGKTTGISAAAKKINSEAAQVIASIQTPLQKYNTMMGKLRTLLNAGAISQTQFNLAVEKARTALGNARAAASGMGKIMSQFSMQAARSMQTAFANFLFDPFHDGLKGMVRGFAQAMQRMIANAAAAKIASSLFGGIGSALGGGAATGLISKGVATGVNLVKFFLLHEGGIVGKGGRPGFAPAAMFANAPRLHAGGFIGSGEVPAILRRGEEVITQNDPRHRTNRQMGNVNITMNVQTTDAGSFRRSEQQIGLRLSETIRRAQRRS